MNCNTTHYRANSSSVPGDPTELYRAGHALTWHEFSGDPAARHLADAPTYPFQRTRHWIETGAARRAPLPPRSGAAALLGERIPLPGSRELRFMSEYSAASPASLAHHRLFGRIIAPAAQHISLFVTAARRALGGEACTLGALAFPHALRLGDQHAHRVQLVLIPGDSGSAAQLLGESAEPGHDWILHASGTVEPRVSGSTPPWPERSVAPAEAVAMTGTDFYRTLDAAGYTLGPSFRWVQSLQTVSDSAWGVLQAPDGALELNDFDLHPGLLDSCFQLLGWCAGVDAGELESGTALYIPFAVERIRFLRPPAGHTLRCHVRVTSPDHRQTHRLKGDVRLTEDDGTLVLEVRGFEARRAPRALLLDEPAPGGPPFHRLAWEEVPLAPALASDRRTWSFLGNTALARAVSARLISRGHHVMHDRLPAPEAGGVVVFCEEPAAGDESGPAQATQLLTLVQTLAALERKPRLWLITRGAQTLPADHGPVSCSSAAAIGLGRIVALEHPELSPVMIDLDPAGSPTEDAVLEAALLAVIDENQLALRGSRRLAARLVSSAPRTFSTRAERLTLGEFGNLDTLTLVPLSRRSPARGDVEIEVRAAGLNFRDVLNALGLLTPHLASLGIHTPGELPLGGECSGVITAVGREVTHVKVGDPVVAALATGCMASHVQVDARFVALKPERLTFAEAATLPVAYLTAYYALRHLADVRPGETILIHAAAGGVGLAAIQVARTLGARVLATASPAKWPLLRALGVVAVGHSRTTTYATEFPPVDVVLNSLTDDHIPRSLELLGPGGRLIEIGKRGIWSADQVAAKRPDVTYHVFDLVEMSRTQPQTIASLLDTLGAQWNRATLPPLPLRGVPLADAAGAFRFMAQGRHTGKLVLLRDGSAPPRPRKDGVYLVTGGLGGIGFQVAGWLGRQGAGTLVLTSRHGPTPEQEFAFQGWRAAGTRVVWRAADLAQTQAAATLVQDVVAEFGPLRGVFHAAGIVDDGVIDQQTPARLAGVFAPKAGAAWQLHLATRAQPLDFFVLFSSFAAVLGSAGQAVYAAANAALDALAHHRRRQGLPGLSINWGPWDGAGMAARLDARSRARLTSHGFRAFSADEGIATLARLLESIETQIAAAPLDHPALLAQFGVHVPPLLRSFAAAGTARTRDRREREALPALPAADRLERVIELLTRRAGAVLGMPPTEALSRELGLTQLGFDSLMAVELKSWIAGEFEVDIPVQQLSGLTLESLARAVLTQLRLGPGPSPAIPAPSIEDILRADARLPEDIRPGHPARPWAAPRTPLLTGATGFLGAFLLHELLTGTDATVHCLVRADNAEEGRRRVVDNLRRYGLPTAFPASRVVIVPGDLARPRFGLAAAEFEALGHAVDSVVHNGAWLNFFYAYETLKPINVLGTIEALRLATHGASKPFHYVSTSGVFYSRPYRGQSLPESDPADRCEGHVLGYSQSKWVAERLVTEAGTRGVPVTVHRAPFITGHSVTGAWNADDFICRLVRGIVALGAMPDLATSMDIVPVDAVAHAMIGLALQPDSIGQRFHHGAGNEVPWAQLAAWLGELGHPVRREPYSDWLARLRALRGNEHALAPFLPLFLEKASPDGPTVPEVFLQSAHARLDGRATVRRLAELSLAPPVIDVGLWNRYLSALRKSGLLPVAKSPVVP